MAQNPDFAGRLAKAHGVHYARHGSRLTQEEIGVLVGRELRRDPVSQQKVQTWFGGREPDYLELSALARVLGVSAGWLAFGEGGETVAQPRATQPPGPGPNAVYDPPGGPAVILTPAPRRRRRA